MRLRAGKRDLFALLAVIATAGLGVSIGWLGIRTQSAAMGSAAGTVVAGVEKAAASAGVVRDICSRICAGDFEQAAERLESAGDPNNRLIAELSAVVREYESIRQNRQLGRKKAYEEQLEKLAELRTTADVNDVNGISAVLAAAYNLKELADEKQKEQLFAEPFTKQVVEAAVRQAAQYEAQGQWLEAYTRCYFWLRQLDKENKQYSEYVEQLSEKAMVRASLQDSPCETWRQRYEGIGREMFTRAIKWLDSYHVEIIDYGRMATKAIERCSVLGEVLSAPGTLENDFPRPDAQQIFAWKAGLWAVLDEIRGLPVAMSRDKFVGVFEKILSLNRATIALPEAVVVAQFAEAALAAVDRYTNLVWPWQVQEFEKNLTKEFTGIGVEISKADGSLKVASLLADTPAYNSGLDAGDIIEAVEGVSTADMSLYCAVRKITGPKGTKVTLTIRHIGSDKAEDITLTRDRIVVPTIRGWQRKQDGNWDYMIDAANRIGYIGITDFSDITAADFERVLGELEKAGLVGLVLDLRFNPGGYLESGVQIADKFLREGRIVSTRPRFGASRIEKAHESDTHPDYPLVVLINEGSASASEIVAGAFQDPLHRRAILVGMRTFGKGSVQTINTYPGGGSQLKYTMAYYHLPSGQPVLDKDSAEKAGGKDWGITPDVEVKLRDDEIRRMLDVQRDNSVLVKAAHDSRAEGLKKHSVEETLAADPQLATAVLVVRARLAEAKAAGVAPSKLSV